MRRVVPVILLSAAGFVAVWQFEPTTVRAPSASAEAGTQTVTGTPETNRYGVVQVQLVFTGNQITNVRLLQSPDTGPTRKALPLLRQELLQAQSAAIDTVSGATQTSDSYIKSLQAAIDAKGA